MLPNSVGKFCLRVGGLVPALGPILGPALGLWNWAGHGYM